MKLTNVFVECAYCLLFSMFSCVMELEVVFVEFVNVLYIVCYFLFLAV